MPHDTAQRREDALLAKAAAWPELPALNELTAQALARLAQRRGIDFATAVLYDRVMRSEQHSAALAAFAAIDIEQPLPPRDKPAILAIAPGAFYRESPHTGADGRALRAEAVRLGIDSVVIPLQSFGALEDNARIIRDWLLACRHDNVVLVSLSKGGAEVKRALAADDAERLVRPLRAWVNLSGVTEHMPLAAWLLQQKLRSQLVRLWFWWRGYDFGVVHDVARPQVIEWRLPASLRAVHVVGVPLRSHLSYPLAKRGHRRLAHLGPNDAGGNVLADVMRWPGELLPIWGADHYLRPRLSNASQLAAGQTGEGELFRRVFYYVCQTPAVDTPRPTLAGVAP